MLLKKEFDKLPNNEKLIIIYWRIIDYPRELSVAEISKRLTIEQGFILKTIKEFNKNCRAKVELFSQMKLYKNLIEEYFDGQ